MNDARIHMLAVRLKLPSNRDRGARDFSDFKKVSQMDHAISVRAEVDAEWIRPYRVGEFKVQGNVGSLLACVENGTQES